MTPKTPRAYTEAETDQIAAGLIAMARIALVEIMTDEYLWTTGRAGHLADQWQARLMEVVNRAAAVQKIARKDRPGPDRPEPDHPGKDRPGSATAAADPD